MATGSAAGGGSLSLYEDLPEPNYDHLDASFMEEGKDGNDYRDEQDDDDLKKKKPSKKMVEVPRYILGTLVVRVVAARDLEVGRAKRSLFP